MTFGAPIDKRGLATTASSERARQYERVDDLALISIQSDIEDGVLRSLNRLPLRTSVLPVETLSDGFHTGSREIVSTVTSAALQHPSMKDIREIATIGPVLRDGDGSIFAVDPREALIGLTERTATAADEFAADYDLTVGTTLADGTSRLYRSRAGVHVLEELAEAFTADERVLFAEYNPLIDAGVSDDDYEVLRFAGDTDSTPWNHEMIGLHEVEQEVDFGGTLVIVIDTLVSGTHPALKESLLADPISSFNLIGDPEGYRHGTAVAGLIGSRLEISSGVTLGLAAGANVLCIAGLNRYGTTGAQARLDAVNIASEIALQGFVDLPDGSGRVDADRVIVNCSWKLGERFSDGVPTANGTDIDLISFRVAFAELVQAGALVVCSAGNSNQEVQPHYPSDYDACISTAGIDGDRKRFQGTLGSNFGSNIDISAPGAALRVLDLPDGYRSGSGTSFAAPHVTAACAHFWAANPSLSASEVREFLLRDGTLNIDDENPSHIGELGSGLIHLPTLMQVDVSQ